MADLSALAKSLQDQVNVIVAHLAKQSLPGPSFIPSDEPYPLANLGDDVEEARRKAQTLSSSINLLLTAPQHHIARTAFKVAFSFNSLMIVLRFRSPEDDPRIQNSVDGSSFLFRYLNQ